VKWKLNVSSELFGDHRIRHSKYDIEKELVGYLS